MLESPFTGALHRFDALEVATPGLTYLVWHSKFRDQAKREKNKTLAEWRNGRRSGFKIPTRVFVTTNDTKPLVKAAWACAESGADLFGQ